MEGLPDPRTDGELLVATIADPQAFAVFYRRHLRGVLSFFRRRTDAPQLAFDLTGETFAAALEAAGRYELRPEPARGWLYGIAWNKLHEARRRGQAEDAVRRQLGMAPIALSDAAAERIRRSPGPACGRSWTGSPPSRGADQAADDGGRSVNDDPVALLERELLRAARRLAPPAPAGDHLAPGGRTVIRRIAGAAG